jgi:hypothetical protein
VAAEWPELLWFLAARARTATRGNNYSSNDSHISTLDFEPRCSAESWHLHPPAFCGAALAPIRKMAKLCAISPAA